MRLKKVPVLTFEWDDPNLPKIVREAREKYKCISTTLDKEPKLLDLVHADVCVLSSDNPKGRKGDFTSENILRTIVVKEVEGLSLREAVLRIADSRFLQSFVRLEKKSTMDYPLLDQCYGAIEPETLEEMNRVLGAYAVAEEKVDPSVIRADTTVVETNIHYPTDSSLLWDTWRVAVRLLKRGRRRVKASCRHRFHTKKIKKLHLYITRYSSSPSNKRKRSVRSKFRTLIERTEWLLDAVREFLAFARENRDLELRAVAAELRGYLPTMEQIVAVARRAQIDREKVKARERVFSLFEPHTELIKRGKRSTPVEFGHVIALSQTPEKFITDYQVFEEAVADNTLPDSILDRHKDRFETVPDVLAADTGFHPGEEDRPALEARIETLAIPRRTRDFSDKVLAHWQRFRAGIEGTISALKRVFRLCRCLFHGFKGFARSVGMSVFAHNLVVLASQKEP